MTHRLRGVLAPVLTPFDADGRPAPERYLRFCRWLLAQDVGLAIFGTNSEASSLGVGEKRALLDTLLEAGLPADRIMAGTGACALPEAVELTRHAVQAGCGGVLMLPPFYYKQVSEEGLYRAYANVIEQVADERLRIYLYHIPQVSQVPVTRGLTERLLKAYPGQIAGMKDSSGDWSNTAMMIEAFGPQGFDVFCGSENFLLRTMQAGGAGCITATGNVNPAAIVELYRRWNEPGAEQRQQALDATRAAFARFPMIAAMKAAVAWQSGQSSWAGVRPPLVELADADRSDLQGLLAPLGFGMPEARALA